MLKYIKYVEVQHNADGYDYFLFDVVDEGFIVPFRVKSRTQPHLIHGIVTVYEQCKLNVALNVSRYYIYTVSSLRLNKAAVDALVKQIDQDGDYIDAVYPSLQYKKRYLNCVKRHIYRHFWAKGITK